MTGITVYHLVGGKITEARPDFGQPALLQQLGAIPPLKQAGVVPR